MPRQARIDVADQLYHVIGRGIERGKIFLDEEDYEDFIRRLEIALKKTGGKVHAWCLMPNHFHLVIVRGRRSLAELMRRVMTGYAVGFNIKYKRAGHLFQNRYKSILCEEEEYLLELVAYIHLNPLRAGMVRNIAGLAKYKWCGHGALLGLHGVGFIEREYVLSHFGDAERIAVRRYETFVNDRRNKYKGHEYSGGGLLKSMGGIGNALSLGRSGEKEMSDARILGSGDFVTSVLKGLEEVEAERMTEAEAKAETKRISGVSFEEISCKSRERRVVRGRAVYCYLRKEKSKASGTEIMKELGISSGTVSYLTHMGRDLAAK